MKTTLAELINSSISSCSSPSIQVDSWEQSQFNTTNSDNHDQDYRSSSSFDKRLRDKLLLLSVFHPSPPPSQSSSSTTSVDMRRQQFDDNDEGNAVVVDDAGITNNGDVDDDDTNSTFHTIRTLFCDATRALQYELLYHRREDSNTTTTTFRKNGGSSRNNNSTQANCHWIPGRIEVMGKHTDYAGGNSLVCATARRGMAVVSTFIENDDFDNEKAAAVGEAAGGDVADGRSRTSRSNSSSSSSSCNDNGGNTSSNNSNNIVDTKKMIKVTIVSVLPPGMDHHPRPTAAARSTIAPFQVDGRTVVHHTIYISGNENQVHREEEDCDESTRAKDWTVYPTTVIRRLHHNFGLIPSGDDGAGGHLFIAISSNLPPASGLSTSSALVTGLFVAVNSHFHLSTSERYRNAIGDEKDKNTVYNLSTYLGNIENGRDYIHNGVVLEGTVHGGVGTFGGSEDHAAILMGKIGELSLLSFCPTRPACIDMMSVNSDLMNEKEDDVTLHPVVGKIDSIIRLPADVTFVIAYTGVKAEKAGGVDGDSSASLGYNSASELARCALNAYLAGGGGSGKRIDDIQTIADAIRWERKHVPSASFSGIRSEMSRRIMAGTTSFDDEGEKYSKSLVQRFVYFYNESEYLVPAAAYALSKKKYDLLGQVVDASHRGAVNVLKNQTEETAWLPLWARGKERALQPNPLLVMDTKYEDRAKDNGRITALAASAFGAGFGGSCWALVNRHEAHEFSRQWQAAFEERFPLLEQCSDIVREFFITDPGPGVFRV